MIGKYAARAQERGSVMLCEKYSYEIINELCNQWNPELLGNNRLSLPDAVASVHANKSQAVQLESILYLFDIICFIFVY